MDPLRIYVKGIRERDYVIRYKMRITDVNWPFWMYLVNTLKGPSD